MWNLGRDTMTNQILIAIAGSGLFAAIVSAGANIIIWTLNNKKQEDEKDESIKDGLQVLLYDRIKCLGLRYIAAGAITSEDLQDLERMHKVYHDKLNGNGFLDDIMHKVRKLPLINS